ncbi:hypothetical protein [Rhizobium leucaenae]|uniref:Uncharacterized protein n=1 Tax=Rhizobium leucaenae TaxID=29450 RepID=A0A7W7A0H0_9HYPH|nr:hypothetical protein [Rhizobium leucaenae]MBB4571543.1 hypothetical protein [Rhizobium leucaenae]
MDLHEQWEALGSWVRAVEQRAWLYIQAFNNDKEQGGAVELQLINGLVSAYNSSFEFVEKCDERDVKGFPELLTRLRQSRRIPAEHFIPSQLEIGKVDKLYIKGLVRDLVISLGLIEADITRLLADVEVWIGGKTELALKHLQRLLVVDLHLKTKWKSAYHLRETACERLGGAHFLWHGLWAFKVDTHGARTDLVTYEPIDERAVGASGGALVLTEWKKIDDPKRGAIERVFAQAKGQALNYVSGALGAIELKSVVHLVAVSLFPIPKAELPPDTIEQGKTIRFVNIVLDPPAPSEGKY